MDDEPHVAASYRECQELGHVGLPPLSERVPDGTYVCENCGTTCIVHGHDRQYLFPTFEGPVKASEPFDMELVAWVGPDEVDGSRGIKGAHMPAGFVPLVAKAEHEPKIRNPEIRAAMQNLSNAYGTRIQFVRFRYVEVIEELLPGN